MPVPTCCLQSKEWKMEHKPWGTVLEGAGRDVCSCLPVATCRSPPVAGAEMPVGLLGIWRIG